jgi:hypothetical protein
MLMLLLVATSSFFVSVKCNRASPPDKVLRLALAASRASYMPFILQGNLYPFGFIKENADTIPKLPTVLLGTLADLMPKPNIFSLTPPQVYNIFLDKGPCKIGLWGASVRLEKDSQVILLKNGIKKIAVFGFRGTAAYSLKAFQENFIAEMHAVNVSGTTFSVHKKFFQLYNNVASWFEAEYNKVPKDYTVILTGYDVGGSQALIASLMVALKTGRRPDAVVVFGALPVGGLVFNHQYSERVGCDRTLSIAVIQDIFIRFPVGAIRPCQEKNVDGGIRKEDVILNGLKSIFVDNFPAIVPAILNGLLPPDLKKIVNIPVKDQQEFLKNSVGTVDKVFEIMLDLENSHHLYYGYEHGLRQAYKIRNVDYGCDRDL